MTITTVHVKEIGMVAPDIMYVCVRDQELDKGSLVELSTPDPATIYSYVERPNPNHGNALEMCDIGGMRNGVQKMFQRFGGVLPTAFMDRTVVDNPASWATIGGRTVTAVYRKTKPFDQSEGVEKNVSVGFRLDNVAMEHELFVKLSGNLAQGGPYTVSVTGNTFPATAFTFNDKVTRCPAIRATLVGHRPGELEKKARLQIWIPGYGTEGRVNFASTYGVSAFELIDAQGVAKFTGTASLAYGPTDADETGPAIRDYASTTVAPKVATAATRANPVMITTSTSHGYSEGAKKHFMGFGQEPTGPDSKAAWGGLNGVILPIHVVNATQFTVPSISTAAEAAPYAAGTFMAGYDSLIRDAFTANVYNTYVYELDFSTFNPASYQGYFRVRLPGIGVSDAFLIEEDAHWVKILKHVQGYYNQSTGIALDPAIGGWERPITYRDGHNGQIMYESAMPAWFSHEAIVPSADPFKINALEAAKTPWTTTNRILDGFVTIRDAGDWDWHLSNEGTMPYFLLELGYRQLPPAVRNFQIPFPKASALDATLYAGTDGLGVQFHMAVLLLDHFRKFQKGDGRVYGGVSYGGEAASEEGGQGRDYWWFASQISPAKAYLLAADPWSNLFYACSAGKIAQVLLENSFTTAGNTWKTSALAAYNWAESLRQDYLANGATGSVIQGYFNTTLGFQTKSGFDNARFASAMAAMFDTAYTTKRLMANAVFYNLTDSKVPYGDIVGAAFPISQDDVGGNAVWEFCQAPSASSYTWNAGANTQISYYSNWPDPPPDTALSEGVWYRAAWKFLSGTKNFSNAALKNMQAVTADHTGKNQTGKSRTSGLGARYPLNLCVRDREAAGLPTSAVPGVTAYFVTGQTGYGFLNFSTDAPINYTAETPTGIWEAWNGTKKIIKPPSLCHPRIESHWDNSNNITFSEYTTFQTIVPEFCRAAILHAWDGNTQITPPTRRVRRALNCS